jgi:RNA polymerase sigma factor (sigma-70 family)
MSENPVVRLMPEFARFRLEGEPDGELLERYVRSRDEDAFAELVRRHGGMVLAVCRRTLRNSADADDAFQAVFLVLARRASAIRAGAPLGPWLHGVAFRTSREALRRSARRLKHETRVTPREPTPEATPDDFRPILDAELSRLPRQFAEVLVLCDMEDRPRREVAGMLAVPEGTIASRLSRARDMLAERLNRRGLGVTAGALATTMTAEAKTPSSAMIAETTRIALGGASASVNELAKAAMGGFGNKTKWLIACVLVAGLGVGGWAAQHDWTPPPEAPPTVVLQPEAKPEHVAEAPPPVDPIERAKARVTGAWRVESGTRDGQVLTPWERQGVGFDLASDGTASLQRLLIRDQRQFTWSIENTTTILLTPKEKNIAPVRLPFEMKDDVLTVSWSDSPARGGPRTPYGSGVYRLSFSRASANKTLPLAVAPSPQNAVGHGLIGTWVWDAELNKTLGSIGVAGTTLTFTRDDAVADEVPEAHRRIFEGKRIYLAGRIRTPTNAAFRFLLIEHLGNPLLVYFVPKPGDDWHCEEAVTAALASGAKPELDRLFLTPFEDGRTLPAGAFRRK